MIDQGSATELWPDRLATWSLIDVAKVRKWWLELSVPHGPVESRKLTGAPIAADGGAVGVPC
jgi:hypothetical protein